MTSRLPSPVNFGGGYNKRIGYIDALKGFATICVVLGHIAGGYYDANSFPRSEDLLYAIHNLIYAFHMPLFMLISGFVFCTAYYDENGVPKKNRIYNQVLNMTCVYIVFSLIYGMIKILFSRFVTNDISVIDLALIPIKSISLYWYLYVLIFLYLIFSFDLVSTLRKTIALTAVTAISVVGQFISVPWFNISSLMYYSFFFYIGMAYRRYGTKKVKFGRLIIVGMFLISCVLVGVFWNTAKQSSVCIDSIPIVKMIAATGISAAIWYVFENIKFLYENRFLKFLGKCSLEIYVIHGFLISGLRPILKYVGITNVYISVLIELILSIALPVAFAEICKYLRIHELIFKPISWIKKKVN